MRNILLTISYDGTNFCGWQKQDGQRTVQGEIEKVLEIVHKSQIDLLKNTTKAETRGAPRAVPVMPAQNIPADVPQPQI